MNTSARRAPRALTALALALIAPLALSGEARAHQCRFKTPDERNLCLAQKELSAYFCRYIKSQDSRAFCYAWLNGNPLRCGAIGAPELKARCEAESQARGDEMKRLFEAAQAAKAAQGAPAR